MGDKFQVGVEALVPANTAAGPHVGHRTGPFLPGRHFPQLNRSPDFPVTLRGISNEYDVSLPLCGACSSGASSQGPCFPRDCRPSGRQHDRAIPSRIVINFTEGVEPIFSSIALQDSAGRAVKVGSPHLVGGDMHLAVDVQPLPPGTYTVIWHATSVDTHKTEGKYSFTVKTP